MLLVALPRRCSLCSTHLRNTHAARVRAYSTAGGASSVLVTPDWLKHKLDTKADVKIIDASWGMNEDYEGWYKEKHIPGAIFFHVDKIADPKTSLPHMLPTKEEFQGHMARLGLTEKDHLIIYDRSAGFVASARVWWTFKYFGHQGPINLLDGGLLRWEQEKGYPVESGAAPAPAQTKYTAQVKVDLVSNMKELLDNIDLKKKQVVDARSAGRFHGTEPEPRPGELLAGNPCLPTGQGLKGGHIPGSINVPYTEVLETKGAWSTLLPASRLQQLFKEKRVDVNAPIVTTCGSGVTAAVVALALHEVGSKNFSIYDGSWTEWGGRPDTPVEV